jgi:hypothetical protein
LHPKRLQTVLADQTEYLTASIPFLKTHNYGSQLTTTVLCAAEQQEFLESGNKVFQILRSFTHRVPHYGLRTSIWLDEGGRPTGRDNINSDTGGQRVTVL